LRDLACERWATRKKHPIDLFSRRDISPDKRPCREQFTFSMSTESSLRSLTEHVIYGIALPCACQRHWRPHWTAAAGISQGRVFRAVSRHGTPWGRGISENVIWYVVRRCAERMQLDHLAPHDLRRTCAKLCHTADGEIEQIQFLLGHAFVLTTERYLGCKQNLEEPVNDRFGCLWANKPVEPQ
jgi:hypothetical protein